MNSYVVGDLNNIWGCGLWSRTSTVQSYSQHQAL